MAELSFPNYPQGIFVVSECDELGMSQVIGPPSIPETGSVRPPPGGPDPASSFAPQVLKPHTRVRSGPKVRYLSVEEIKRLVEFCPSEFKPMILAPIYTGVQ